jgi:hypothetical protein
MTAPVDFDVEVRLAKYRLTWQRIAARVFADDDDSFVEEANTNEKGDDHESESSSVSR